LRRIGGNRIASTRERNPASDKTGHFDEIASVDAHSQCPRV